MVDAPVVAVRGEAIRQVPAEIAQFSVTVAARDKERQATLARLAARSDAVRALLDGYGDAIERRETSGLQVRPELKRAGERIAAYHGSVTTTVTVGDFSLLGELMLRLADQEQTSVSGPWWQLRPDSPVHREARHAAIGEALTRAREYAEALGARVTGLIELADTGLADRPMLRAVAFAAGESAAPELQLDPQPQTVQATVEARFAISEPTVVTRPAG